MNRRNFFLRALNSVSTVIGSLLISKSTRPDKYQYYNQANIVFQSEVNGGIDKKSNNLKVDGDYVHKINNRLSDIYNLNLTDYMFVEFQSDLNKIGSCPVLLKKNNTSKWTQGNPGFGTIYFEDVTGNKWERVYEGPISPSWFGVTGDGITDDTISMQACFDFAVTCGTPDGPTMIIDIPVGDFLLNTIVLHGPLILRGQGWQTRFIPHPNMPKDGAVLLSLSGSATRTTDKINNTKILKGIYGDGTFPPLRSSYDLRGCVIEDIFFYSPTPVNKRAVWLTGFTAGASINRIKVKGFVYGDSISASAGVITINGSWVWSMNCCDIYGFNNHYEGAGICIALNNQGTHLDSHTCNNFTLYKNRFQEFQRGIVIRRGLNATIESNNVESCSKHAILIVSGSNIRVTGNYIEGNAPIFNRSQK